MSNKLVKVELVTAIANNEIVVNYNFMGFYKYIKIHITSGTTNVQHFIQDLIHLTQGYQISSFEAGPFIPYDILQLFLTLCRYGSNALLDQRIHVSSSNDIARGLLTLSPSTNNTISEVHRLVDHESNTPTSNSDVTHEANHEAKHEAKQASVLPFRYRASPSIPARHTLPLTTLTPASQTSIHAGHNTQQEQKIPTTTTPITTADNTLAIEQLLNIRNNQNRNAIHPSTIKRLASTIHHILTNNRNIHPPVFNMSTRANYIKVKNFIYNQTRVWLNKDNIKMFIEMYDNIAS